MMTVRPIPYCKLTTVGSSNLGFIICLQGATITNYSFIQDDIIVSAGKERNASSSSSNPPWTPYISYKKNPEAPILDSFTNPDYFTGAFPTLFPFGIGGHLGDISGNRPKKVSLKDFAKYTMMHHSHMYAL
jgi:hypothetical protein